MGVHHGSSVDFQWADGRHKILGVMVRSGYHPRMGFENRSNPHRVLLVRNVSLVPSFFKHARVRGVLISFRVVIVIKGEIPKMTRSVEGEVRSSLHFCISL
jgi:hypothetical protein